MFYTIKGENIINILPLFKISGLTFIEDMLGLFFSLILFFNGLFGEFSDSKIFKSSIFFLGLPLFLYIKHLL